LQQLGLDEGLNQREDGAEKQDRLPVDSADHLADRLDAHTIDHEQRQGRTDDRHLGRDDARRQGLPDHEQGHHEQQHEQRQHQETGSLNGNGWALVRQDHPRRPDLRQQQRQQRHNREHGQHATQADHPQIVEEGQPDRTAYQKSGGVAHQGEHPGGVTDDGRDDKGPDDVDLERPADADDDRRHQDDGGGIRQNGA
jgi:hypothetical protein